MIFIAHRGNLNGPNPDQENRPKYILEALNKKYHAEIDVWLEKDGFWLGHDTPQYPIFAGFLFKNKNKLWCHAKNIAALQEMIKQKIYCFWHQTDDVTLTSGRYLWTYPNKQLTPNSIAVLPELNPEQNWKMAAGICSDYVERYKNEFRKS